MSEDSRLYQKNPKTKRYNVVSLPRSGAFGTKKVLDKGYFGGPEICACGAGVGCSMVTNPMLPDVCDIIVYRCLTPDFVCVDWSGSTEVRGAYQLSAWSEDGYPVYVQYTGTADHFLVHGIEQIQGVSSEGWYVRSEDTLFYFSSSNYPIPLGDLSGPLVFQTVSGLNPPPVLEAGACLAYNYYDVDVVPCETCMPRFYEVEVFTCFDCRQNFYEVEVSTCFDCGHNFYAVDISTCGNCL
jgi:hypothetical protein